MSDTKVSQAMDWLQFTSAIAGSLAWPIVIIVIFFSIRPQIIDLIGKLKNAKFAGIELTLQEAKEGQELLDQVSELVDADEAAAEPQNDESNIGSGSPSRTLLQNLNKSQKIEKLLEIEPSLAVLDVWADVEREIVEMAQSRGLALDGAGNISIIKVFESIARETSMASLFMEQFRKLRSVRNQAAHNKITEEEGRDFAQLAHRFIGLISTLRRP